MAKKSFSSWFSENLTVGRFPLPGEVSRLPYASHLVNVSDEYIHYNATAALRRGVYAHWFPLNECVGHLGLNSIFAALCVLHQAESDDASVLLHCHAGANRSPLIQAAYYFLRTGRHLEDCHKVGSVLVLAKEKGNEVSFEQAVSNGTEPIPNMLQINCASNLLPPLGLMEKFLKLLGTKLEELEPTHRGGLLTQLKTELGLQ